MKNTFVDTIFNVITSRSSAVALFSDIHILCHYLNWTSALVWRAKVEKYKSALWLPCGQCGHNCITTGLNNENRNRRPNVWSTWWVFWYSHNTHTHTNTFHKSIQWGIQLGLKKKVQIKGYWSLDKPRFGFDCENQNDPRLNQAYLQMYYSNCLFSIFSLKWLYWYNFSSPLLVIK